MGGGGGRREEICSLRQGTALYKSDTKRIVKKERNVQNRGLKPLMKLSVSVFGFRFRFQVLVIKPVFFFDNVVLIYK